jgi:hypothetical protein
MHLFFRIIAILLVLTTGGVFQTLAFAGDEHVACAGEEEDGDACIDCAFDCGMCLCCPLRAAPASQRLEAVVRMPVLDMVSCLADAEPVLSGAATDIFQPPRR